MGRRGGGNGSGRWFIFDRRWARPVESEWGLGGGEINYPIATIFDDVPGVVVTKKNQNGDWGVVNKSNRNYF